MYQQNFTHLMHIEFILRGLKKMKSVNIESIIMLKKKITIYHTNEWINTWF